jgi:hypothetical protein
LESSGGAFRIQHRAAMNPIALLQRRNAKPSI